MCINIGQDPDDEQSLVRLLHYANEFEIEGINKERLMIKRIDPIPKDHKENIK